jgi:hypothetical protein
MADEQQVETATTDTETKAVETTEATAPAEAKKTEAKAAQDFEQRVPLARLNKVIQERNQLRERLAAMEREGTRATASDDSEDDGGTMTKARALIEETATKMLERELGVPLSKVKEALSSTETASAAAWDRTWEKLCTSYKLDPQNEDMQAYVIGLGQAGAKIEQAMERAQKLFGTTKKAANVEETGVTGSMTTSDQVFWDRESAVNAAAKGIRARHVSLDEVLKRQREQAAKR